MACFVKCHFGSESCVTVSNYSFHQASGHCALLEWVMMPCTSDESDLSLFFYSVQEKKIDIL